jgi:hypothetical protein
VNEEELMLANEYAWQILTHAGVRRVHHIIDVSGLDQLPELRVLTRQKIGQHPKMGWTISVGINKPVLRFAITVLSQLFRQRTQLLPTVNEALVFLESVDHELHADKLAKTMAQFTPDQRIVYVDGLHPDQNLCKPPAAVVGV